ncbi:MAG TPA: hypothetical protein PK564_02870, partial [bacterium]|nr:hypothetical protein [bacterium]
EKEISRFRLADWYMWSLSIARALDKEEKFKSIIEQQKKMMLEDQLQDDEKIEILYNYLMEHVTDRPYEISSKELKTQLNEQVKTSKPLFTGHIGYFLKRAIVTFKGYGFNIENLKLPGGKRIWRISKIMGRWANMGKPENKVCPSTEVIHRKEKNDVLGRRADGFILLGENLKKEKEITSSFVEKNDFPLVSKKTSPVCPIDKKVSDSNVLITGEVLLSSSPMSAHNLSLVKCSDCKNFNGENKTSVYICPVVKDRYYPTQEHYCNEYTPPMIPFMEKEHMIFNKPSDIEAEFNIEDVPF